MSNDLRHRLGAAGEQLAAEHSLNPLPRAGVLTLDFDTARGCLNGHSAYVRVDGRYIRLSVNETDRTASRLELSGDLKTFTRRDYALDDSDLAAVAADRAAVAPPSCPAPGAAGAADPQAAAQVRAMLASNAFNGEPARVMTWRCTPPVQAGASATYALTVTAAQGTSLASAVALACSGLPSSSTCSFNPANVASGATTQSIALTVSTTPKSSPAHASLTGRGGISLAALSVLSALLLPRRRRRLGMIAMFAVLCIGIPGCSGGGSGSGGGGGGGGGGSGTPSGNYTITVTASQSTIYQTTQALTLTVQ